MWGQLSTPHGVRFFGMELLLIGRHKLRGPQRLRERKFPWLMVILKHLDCGKRFMSAGALNFGYTRPAVEDSDIWQENHIFSFQSFTVPFFGGTDRKIIAPGAK